MAHRYKDVGHLSDEIANALEDHALIAYTQRGKTSEIVKSFINDYLKEMVKEFYDWCLQVNIGERRLLPIAIWEMTQKFFIHQLKGG